MSRNEAGKPATFHESRNVLGSLIARHKRRSPCCTDEAQRYLGMSGYSTRPVYISVDETALNDRLAKVLEALRDECDARGWKDADPEMMGIYGEACAALVDYDNRR